jgi:hypothetical protein
MMLTRDFKEMVAERAKRDPAFARALLDEAATLFLSGEPWTAYLMLHDFTKVGRPASVRRRSFRKTVSRYLMAHQGRVVVNAETFNRGYRTSAANPYLSWLPTYWGSGCSTS